MRNKGHYLYDQSVIETFMKASDTLNRAVEHTLGNNGANSAVPTPNGFLSIINDGKSIIENIASEDKAMNLALNTLKESSLATNMNAGDGTTSTIVMQNKLLNCLLNADFSKYTPKELNRIRDELLESLKGYIKNIESDEDLRKVINVSLGGETLTDLVLDAFKATSQGQKPALIKTKNTAKTEVVTVNGISLAPIEVNPVVMGHMPHTLDEPVNVILFNQSISRLDKAFTVILNNIAKSDRKTILIYSEIMPSVMDQLLFNIQEGSLNLVPIRLACNPDKFDEMFVEMEKYFNCKAYTSLNSYQQDIHTFGTATGYILNKDSIVIKNDNEDYISEILPATSSYISVGFITFSQQEEDYRRIEDAIHSGYNALQYGYVIGGGYTFKCLAENLSTEYSEIKEALSYIYYILKKDNLTDYDNRLQENVFDSYKVAEQVILNAFTVVSQIKSIKEMLISF